MDETRTGLMSEEAHQRLSIATANATWLLLSYVRSGQERNIGQELWAAIKQAERERGTPARG